MFLVPGWSEGWLDQLQDTPGCSGKLQGALGRSRTLRDAPGCSRILRHILVHSRNALGRSVMILMHSRHELGLSRTLRDAGRSGTLRDVPGGSDRLAGTLQKHFRTLHDALGPSSTLWNNPERSVLLKLWDVPRRYATLSYNS